jgi:hypothetical protein
MSDTLEPNNNSHEYNGYYGITIPKEIYEAAQTLHIYFEKQMIQGWEFLSVADRRIITKLERERDETMRQLDNLKASSIHSCHDQCQRPMCVLRRERDEAREKLDEEMKWHHRTHTELVQTQCKILDMQMGRDEIQEKYDKLATEHMLVVNKICGERDEAREEHRKLKIILDIIKKETL